MYRYIYRVHIATEDDVRSLTVPLTWCLVGKVHRPNWDDRDYSFVDMWWIRQMSYYAREVKVTEVLNDHI